MAFVVPEKDVLGNQAAIDVTQKEQDIGRDCGDDHQRPTVYSHNYNDIGSDPSPAGSGNQSGLVGFAEDDSDNRGELWEQRLADSRVSDDEDVIMAENGEISRSESRNNSTRSITGLSVRTRHGILTHLSRG